MTEFGERRTLVISSVEIDGQQEVGNESGQKLHHQSVRTACNEMIDIEMAFPPCEEGFDFPAKSIDESDLERGQIGTVGGDP